MGEEFEPGASSSIPAPEARGSERFWSRLRSAIPVAVAIAVVGIALVAESQIAPKMELGSGTALLWAICGPTVAISAYGISTAVLDSFSNRSQK